MVEQFQRRRGINFTDIYAFELAVNAPKDVWESVPEDLLPYYHYINVGVSTQGKYNPWNILRAIAKPEDFVVIKLDIDSPWIENTLVDQVLDDPSLFSLIDEMTYEHHTYIPEMVRWWKITGGNLTLASTYSLFTDLRTRGIRMHSWP